MAYRIVSSDSHKIILERESTKVAARVFVLIGSVFFLIGVGLNFLMTTWEMPFMLFRILFPLFGLIAVQKQHMFADFDYNTFDPILNFLKFVLKLNMLTPCEIYIYMLMAY